MEDVLGLRNARILVTASTKGIGFGVAAVLLRLGARVVINGRGAEGVAKALERLRGLGEAHGIPADLSEPDNAQRLVEEAARILGGLDGLVYIPPPPKAGPFAEISESDWEESINILVRAPLKATSAAIPYLEKSRNPSIVYITSIAVVEPDPNIATSSVLRQVLHGLVGTLARDLADKGIRVNAVAPGYILTDRVREVARKRAESWGVSFEDALKRMSAQIPMQRLGNPEDIGWAVAFLLSPRASYITGITLLVDGGLHKFRV